MRKRLFRLLIPIIGYPRAYNMLFGKGARPIHPSVHVDTSIIRGDCHIGEGSKVQKDIELIGRARLEVGRYTSLNGPKTTIYSGIHGIKIGSFCSIARGVDIQEFNHNIERPTSYFILQNIFGKYAADITSKGKVEIGNDVWIGCQAVILSGVKIGDGAVIAANSVVSTDIPPYAIAGGVPAKVLRYRFPEEVISGLLKIRWWDWPLDKIRRNEAFFSAPMTADSFSRIVE